MPSRCGADIIECNREFPVGQRDSSELLLGMRSTGNTLLVLLGPRGPRGGFCRTEASVRGFSSVRHLSVVEGVKTLIRSRAPSYSMLQVGADDGAGKGLLPWPLSLSRELV